MTRRRRAHRDYFIDANGCLAERVELDGLSVILHYDDVPDSDKTVVDGLPTTTALRALLDVAVECDPVDLDIAIRDCLQRGLFTVAEARARIAQPDMASRPGTSLFARALARVIG